RCGDRQDVCQTAQHGTPRLLRTCLSDAGRQRSLLVGTTARGRRDQSTAGPETPCRRPGSDARTAGYRIGGGAPAGSAEYACRCRALSAPVAGLGTDSRSTGLLRYLVTSTTARGTLAIERAPSTPTSPVETHHRSGAGNVERLDVASHRDADPAGEVRGDTGGQACALIAQHISHQRRRRVIEQ